MSNPNDFLIHVDEEYTRPLAIRLGYRMDRAFKKTEVTYWQYEKKCNRLVKESCGTEVSMTTAAGSHVAYLLLTCCEDWHHDGLILEVNVMVVAEEYSGNRTVLRSLMDTARSVGREWDCNWIRTTSHTSAGTDRVVTKRLT